ncbi:hypothetical protein os1_21750 [Comamonadaceae bacterium OS-1]|nr:hypothetical protein os1_21750 [Comamonadaceae bacterium OS-1]
MTEITTHTEPKALPPSEIRHLTLSQLNPGNNLQEALSSLEADVRKQPTSLAPRWALIEMLCLLGHWERALKQLQASAKLAPETGPTAQTQAQLLRSLVRAEHQRASVFSGQLLPVPVVDRPQWMEDLARAIAFNAKGQHQQADPLRRAALDAAPTHAMRCVLQNNVQAANPRANAPVEEGGWAEQRVSWIADSDTRLGPVCEFIVAGGYRWVAFADIASVHIERPTRLLDLVWLPATLTLRSTQAGSKAIHGFIPTRYSGTERVAAEVGSQQRDALVLAHLTHWQDVGETGVFALGQKTLMGDGVDFPLLDLRELHRAEPELPTPESRP